jgi:uncharacterized protein (TIGR01777 family)
VTWSGWNSTVDSDTAIVNLAGAGLADARWTEQRKREIRESRLSPGRAIASAVRHSPRKPRVVVQASAVGYYGPLDDRIVTESDLPGSDFLARLCVDWEASTVEVEAFGVRRPIIRSGMVLSAAGGALPRLLLPFRFFVGGPLGSGAQWVSWVHIDDEVAAILYLLDSDLATGPYNVVSPAPLTNRDFARLLASMIGRPAVLPTPPVALRLMFGEMSTILLEGQRVAPRCLTEGGFQFEFPDARLALSDLLTPRRVPRGL